MKKVLVMLLVLAMTVGMLAGCSGKKDEGKADGGKAAADVRVAMITDYGDRKSVV